MLEVLSLEEKLILNMKLIKIRNNDASISCLYLSKFPRCRYVICDKLVRTIAKSLSNNTNLLFLYLPSNLIGSNGAISLAEMLKCNRSITKLDLRDNFIGDLGAKAIAESLQYNTTLKYLDLCGNNIGSDGIQFLAETLKHNNTTLTHLVLRCNDNTIDSIQALSEMLKYNMALKHLDLTYTKLGNRGIQILSESLVYNSTLIELEIESNDITDKGTESLARALEQNSTLEIIKFDDDGYDSDGENIQAVKQHLKVNNDGSYIYFKMVQNFIKNLLLTKMVNYDFSQLPFELFNLIIEKVHPTFTARSISMFFKMHDGKSDYTNPNLLAKNLDLGKKFADKIGMTWLVEPAISAYKFPSN